MLEEERKTSVLADIDKGSSQKPKVDPYKYFAQQKGIELGESEEISDDFGEESKGKDLDFIEESYSNEFREEEIGKGDQMAPQIDMIDGSVADSNNNEFTIGDAPPVVEESIDDFPEESIEDEFNNQPFEIKNQVKDENATVQMGSVI